MPTASKFFILCILIAVINRSFIILGFYENYNIALMFSFITIVVFLFGFYYKREDLKEIWKNWIGKIIIISAIILCLVLPSALTLLDPIFTEPKLIISSTKPTLYYEYVGDSLETTIIIKNERGSAWNFKLKAISLDFYHIYINGVENGEWNIDYIPFRHQDEARLKVVASYYAPTNKTEWVVLPYKYTNARGMEKNDLLTILIIQEFLEVPLEIPALPPPPPAAAFPWIWTGVALIVVLAGAAYYYYTQKKGEDESFISFWSARGRV